MNRKYFDWGVLSSAYWYTTYPLWKVRWRILILPYSLRRPLMIYSVLLQFKGCYWCFLGSNDPPLESTWSSAKFWCSYTWVIILLTMGRKYSKFSNLFTDLFKKKNRLFLADIGRWLSVNCWWCWSFVLFRWKKMLAYPLKWMAEVFLKEFVVIYLTSPG